MRLDGSTKVDAGGVVAPPAFQVILLGAGGGPVEDNVTGLLVRSTATNWAKGSVLAVDAGTHLAAVVNIIEEHLPQAVPKQAVDSLSNGAHSAHPQTHSGPVNGHETENSQAEGVSPQLVLSTGPLSDFELPHETAKANAAYFVRNLITTYLITHPHLDHISGFVINTAGFQHTSRPKRLAGLPSTIDAFKTHVFNDIIWPNLSDEDGGVGLVSYMRLAEGGNLAIGEGEGRGYIEVCDGLAVKSWSVSHGKCMHNHAKHGSGSGNTQEAFSESISRRPSQNVMTPTGNPSYGHASFCVTDSSAFFLRDDHTGKEILIFGDVEPDSLSLSPRTAQVWSDAAPKVVAGLLKAIFIECSYDESQSDETLFGHLAPRHVIEELQNLADQVKRHKRGTDAEEDLAAASSHGVKRKRISIGSGIHEELETRSQRGRRTSNPQPPGTSIASGRRKSIKSNVSPATVAADDTPIPSPRAPADSPSPSMPLSSHHRRTSSATTAAALAAAASTDQLPTPGTTIAEESSGPPLEGLQVIIIHVKDNLKDGTEAGDIILEQLIEREKEARLGCSFQISKSGTSILL